MITIDDYDMPITVAEKIITGTRQSNPSPVMKAIAVAVTGNAEAGETEDMFSIDDLKEIADYLMTYYEAHKNND